MSGPRFATRSPAAETAGRSPAEVLRSVGPLLYGDLWQCAAARLLGVSDRSVRYWLAGKRTPPERIIAALEDALRERQKAIQEHFGGSTKTGTALPDKGFC